MIWIFAGTSDAKDIIKEIITLNLFEDIMISTATEEGKILLEKELIYKSNINIIGRPLDYNEIIDIINENNINLILDITHPYAVIISNNLLEISKLKEINYIRYERSSVLECEECLKGIDYQVFSNIKSMKKYFEDNNIINKNILLTTGSKDSKEYKEFLDMNNVFIRIIPTKSSLEKVYNSGFSMENIIAMKGPFSYGLNIEIMKSLNIDIIITKDGGLEGGLMEKLKASKDLGVRAFIVKRPKQDSSNKYNNKKNLINALKNLRGN